MYQIIVKKGKSTAQVFSIFQAENTFYSYLNNTESGKLVKKGKLIYTGKSKFKAIESVKELILDNNA